MSNQFAFSTGGEEAEEAAARSGGNYAKAHYLIFKEPGDSYIVRYLSDAPMWFTIQQHISAPTKNPPKDWPDGRNFPANMPATCRYEKAFNGHFHDCYICDAKLTSSFGKLCRPTPRTWALACLREEVRDPESGKVTGYRDQMRTVEYKDEKDQTQTREERALVVVNQAWSNYFEGLNAMFGTWGTITGRDFVVKQSGKGLDKTMNHIPLDPIYPDGPGTLAFGGPRCHKPRQGETNTETWFGAQVVVDEPAHPGWDRYVKAAEEQSLSLTDIFVDRASDDYFALFFDPNKTAKPRGDGKATEGGQDQEQAVAQPSGDVSPESVEAMRNRVKQRTGGGRAQEAASEPAVEQPQPVAAASTGENY